MSGNNILLVALYFKYHFVLRSAGGKLVDATPEEEKSLKDELEKIARIYGADKADFAKFPTFTFTGLFTVFSIL